MRNAIMALLLGATLFTVVPGARADEKERRYYDRQNKDYHAWNDNEAKAYRHWVVEERKEKYRDYNRARRADQQEYWRWRHQHQDWK